MEKLFINIFQMSISASYLIFAVLFVRFLLRRAPKSMRSFLWLLVGIRLLVPFSVESVFSLIPNTKTVDTYIYDAGQMEMDMTAGAADIIMPVSQPVQTAYIPSVDRNLNRTQTAVSLCTKLWLFGVALMLGYMLISWLKLKNRVKMSVPADIELDNGNVKIYQSDMIESPFLFGIISPRIYVPNHIAEEELPYVILHEMTHRKRKDYLIKPIGFLFLSVYWFNPCVWMAYIMLCKDIELICDEKVIRQLGVSYKKEYSQALLNSAVNRRMIAACPVAFGEVSVKERVKNVLHYKKPAFWVLVAAVLACIIVPVCFMTQKKADASEKLNPGELESEEIDLDMLQLAGEYEMFHPDRDKYFNVPRLSLNQNGDFSFGYDSLSSYMPNGAYNLAADKLTAVTDDGKYHYSFQYIEGAGLLIFDAEKSSDVTRINAEMSMDAPIENGSIFVKSNALTTIRDAKTMSDELNQALYQGGTMTVDELEEKQTELTVLQQRLTVEEAKLKKEMENSKTLQLEEEQMTVLETKHQALLQELEDTIQQLEEDQAACQSVINAAATDMQTVRKTIEQWAQAFCDRDAKTIIKLASANVEKQLIDQDLLAQEGSFGWSSPWPWGDEFDESAAASNYRVISVTERSAEILYYAWTSDPHVTVWREILTYKAEEEGYVITSETLEFMDSICIAEEFTQAYPGGITKTTMDYRFNGAGEALNNNAVANKESWFYADLFEPDSAAVYLLNILKNPNKVGTSVTKSETDTDTCTVTFEFYEDGSSVSVQMMQPYGTDGIWIPYTGDSEDTDAKIDTASIAPYIVTNQNVRSIIEDDMKQLEALFPNRHEFVSNVEFPYNVDLNGDGIEENIEFTNLFYNGGDGGYALTVTDTGTGKKIPLPDGYTEESGFPIYSTYVEPEGEEARLLIQLGQFGREETSRTLATIMLDPLYYIYEHQNMRDEFKKVIQNPSDRNIRADALSGCSITYDNENNPVIFLKTYVSGFLGHVDTLGYVVTELKLQKDNTWKSNHWFLLDSWDYTSVATQDENEANWGNGVSILPFDKKSDVNFLPLIPEE